VFIYIKAAAGRHSPPTAITNTTRNMPVYRTGDARHQNARIESRTLRAFLLIKTKPEIEQRVFCCPLWAEGVMCRRMSPRIRMNSVCLWKLKDADATTLAQMEMVPEGKSGP
jgi:hypothetical protein